MKAIIFDLDETLIDRNSTVRGFLEKQYDHFAPTLTCEKEAFVESVLTNQENGYADKLTAYLKSCAQLGESIAEELFEDFRKSYGSEASSIPGVIHALEQLFPHYKLAIVTNGRSRVQNSKIDSCGFRHLFSTIKISEEEGIKKPAEEIYIRCLTDLGFKASECLFVGDNPISDVIMPRKLGMKAIWIRSIYFEEPEKADALIDSVAELPCLLKNWNKPNQTLHPTAGLRPSVG